MNRIHVAACLAALFAFAITLASCGDGAIPYRGGTYQGETRDSLPDGYGTWTGTDGSTYRGFWKNGMRDGQGTANSADSSYQGSFQNDVQSGYGILRKGDSTVYAGQWRDGKRQGMGTTTDRRGRRITGVWADDTLRSGIRTEKAGIYQGEMRPDGTAEGHGQWQGTDFTFYEGHWTADSRDLFGFQTTPDGRMKAGEWKSGSYKGERLVYTSDRIYGIDISKYQHQSGRKRYQIDWQKLRITNLGTISRKRIDGLCDYPVSFVYVKSTEGTSVRNPYYASDYRQARRLGLRVGTYHYLSHLSDATAQARFFLRSSRFSSGDFPPVLDVEPTEKQVRMMGGAEGMFRRIRAWMELVESSTGCRPVLYVSQTFVKRYLDAAPDIKSRYQVWIARYGEYKPDVRLAWWQLCPDGRVRGIRGEVDINVFNGYREQFDDFCRSNCIP